MSAEAEYEIIPSEEHVRMFEIKIKDSTDFSFVYHKEHADELPRMLYSVASKYGGEWLLKKDEITVDNIVEEWITFYDVELTDGVTYHCSFFRDWDNEHLSSRIRNRESDFKSTLSSLCYDIKRFEEEWGKLTPENFNKLKETILGLKPQDDTGKTKS